MNNKHERCFLCDDLTGSAGKSDDSMYDVMGQGPYCEHCLVKKQTKITVLLPKYPSRYFPTVFCDETANRIIIHFLLREYPQATVKESSGNLIVNGEPDEELYQAIIDKYMEMSEEKPTEEQDPDLAREDRGERRALEKENPHKEIP